jgi:hypothetical protein
MFSEIQLTNKRFFIILSIPTFNDLFFFLFLTIFKFELGIRERSCNPKFLALTAMEFLMQEAAVFSRYTRATARSSLYAVEKQGL